MKIRRIQIKSFGSLVNRHSGEIGDGLTLVHGNNEAGKTTFTEFIRSTLFPTRKQRYPSRDKSDSGTIVVEMDSGERRIYERKGNKVTEADGHPLPGEEFNLDAETYMAIYAMGLDQLVDAKLITGGEMRTRFLVVPGGENIPEISDGIQKDMVSLMNEARITSTKGIGMSIAEVKKAENEIEALKESKREYDSLFLERNSLEEKSRKLKFRSEITRNEERRREVILSQKENMERLDSLEEKKKNLSPGKVSEADEKTYNTLITGLETFRNRKAVAEGNAPPEELGGRNTSDVLSLADDIEAAWDARSKIQVLEISRENKAGEIDEEEKLIKSYTSSTGWTEKAALAADTGKHVVERAEREAYTLHPVTGKKTIPIAIFLAGILVTALGIISLMTDGMPFFSGSSMAYVLVAAGAILAVLGLYILGSVPESVGDWDVWIQARGYPRGTTAKQVCLLTPKLDIIKKSAKSRDDLKVRMASDVSEAAELTRVINRPAEALNVKGSDYNDTAIQLNKLLKIARKHEGEASVGVLEKEITKAEEELSDFLESKGGEEAFLKAIGESRELKETEREIANLTESMEASSKLKIEELRKMIAEVPGEEVKGSEGEEEELNETNRRIGELDAQLASIMDDGAIKSARARKAAAEAKLLAECKKWGTLSLADHLISEAADHFYKDMQPDVVKTANKYLKLMTGGKYSLDDDPREKDLCIWDGYTKKKPDQWSSGLGDQVMLSVKLAIAENMTKETLPVILDDVLVRFDASRKQGACKALVDFAEGRQVIMFTCDNQLLSLCSLEGNINVIDLN